MDAAVHDAFGNVNGIDTYAGYGPDYMAHDLSRWLGPAYKGKYPADYLRPQPLLRVPIFHLVGGLDKLTRQEVEETDPADGLPNCLEDWIARDGVYCLKVKLRGTDLEWDVDRLLRVHQVGQAGLAAKGIASLYLTADTNEQCESP